MNLETMLNKAMSGDEKAYVALKAIFGHQELKIVDLGNKNRRLCESIRTASNDYSIDLSMRNGFKEVLAENEFIPRP